MFAGPNGSGKSTIKSVLKPECLDLWSLAALFLFAASALADESRFIQQIPLPDGRVVVVAEGDLEPRSIGSYSVCLYGGKNPDHPTDDFLCGIVRPRDGTIAGIGLEDVDGDSTNEFLVIVQSAGSGGFLSTNAFALGITDITIRDPVEKLIFHVLGYVQNPGSYAWRDGLNVEQAIELAGGITESADHRKCYVIKAGEKKPLDLSRNPESGRVNLDAGDTLIVGASWFPIEDIEPLIIAQ